MATKQLTIPMFPLGIMLLPGATKTLHIFEEKYKQIILDEDRKHLNELVNLES